MRLQIENQDASPVITKRHAFGYRCLRFQFTYRRYCSCYTNLITSSMPEDRWHTFSRKAPHLSTPTTNTCETKIFIVDRQRFHWSTVSVFNVNTIVLSLTKLSYEELMAFTNKIRETYVAFLPLEQMYCAVCTTANKSRKLRVLKLYRRNCIDCPVIMLHDFLQYLSSSNIPYRYLWSAFCPDKKNRFHLVQHHFRQMTLNTSRNQNFAV